jgi:hypothetical protein
MDKGETLARFVALFRGNPRTVGMWNPENGRARTEERAATEHDFKLHLQGKLGVGQVPILDDNTTTWAAIDLDNHGEESDIDLPGMVASCRDKGIPLVCCRSKSGGIHLYAFFKGPVSATAAQGTLRRWAGVLHGRYKFELFPKQTTLKMGAGKLQAGNWLNLPYFDAAATNRYAYHDGKQLSVEAFLELAEASRFSLDDAKKTIALEHPEAPPCIQRMFSEGVPQGYRNEALFNITIYRRKQDADGFVEAALADNDTVFGKPLARFEAKRTIESAGRPHYNYRCSEEPQRGLCDRPVCLHRKFGVSDGDAHAGLNGAELPKLEDLAKFTTDPVRWEVTVNGKRITAIPSDVLIRWEKFSVVIMDHLMIVPPMIKELEWKRMLGDLMTSARVLDVPDEASPSGLVRSKLAEFLNKIDWKHVDDTDKSRAPILRGLPVGTLLGSERWAVFRGPDFVDYLRRTKSEELKGTALWFAIRLLGVEPQFIKYRRQVIRVWGIRATDDNEYLFKSEKLDAPEYKSEI